MMNGWVTIKDLDSRVRVTIHLVDEELVDFFGSPLSSDSFLAGALLASIPGERFSLEIEGRNHQMEIIASQLDARGAERTQMLVEETSVLQGSFKAGDLLRHCSISDE